MKSLVEIAEYTFGDTLGTRMVQQLAKTNGTDLEKIAEFMDSVEDFSFSPYIPERENSEIRAFVGYTHSDKSMIFFDVDENGIDLNYFKRLLLYYDRVALTVHTEFFYEKRFNREAISSFVQLLTSIKPLVEHNVINFVAEPVLYNPAEDFVESFERFTGSPIPPGELRGYYDDIEGSMLGDLNACYALDLDYVTTQRGNWKQIAKWFGGRSENRLESEAKHFWATSLIHFDLPNLSNLTYDDIISIRRNSSAFEEWRRTLSELFELLAKNNPASFDELGREVQYFSKHVVGEKRRKLQEEIRRSSLKEHLKNNSLLITVSFLGQLLASHYLDIKLTNQLVTLLVGSSGVASLLPFLEKKIRNRKNPLLVKYYSLLQDAS